MCTDTNKQHESSEPVRTAAPDGVGKPQRADAGHGPGNLAEEGAAELEQVVWRVFLARALQQGDLRAWCGLRRMEIERRRLELEEKRFQREREKVLAKAETERRAKEIADDPGDNSEITEQLGRTLFGENWRED